MSSSANSGNQLANINPRESIVNALADLIVIAIGGHSLLDPALPPTVANQFAVTAKAMIPIADLLEQGHKLLLTHGNGPQVGFMQLRSELSKGQVHEVPLDSLVADTQGSLGYMIQRGLREEMDRRGIPGRAVTIITEIQVDENDDAFEEPTKPIGRFYTQDEADELSRAHGWLMVDDANRGYRRVVPSPTPVRIVQLDTIRHLAEEGDIVVCCGGGGIPVSRAEDGVIHGLAAVIDKDRASALLAVLLQVKHLVITTGIDAVYKDFLTDNPVKITELTVKELRKLAKEGHFPPGSMRPKMEAALYYLNRCAGVVTICHPDDLVEALEGRKGTRITKE
jgi:carbamate kinase